MSKSQKKVRIKPAKPTKRYPQDRPPRRWTNNGHKPKRDRG